MNAGDKMSGRDHGTITWWGDRKYGFIKSDSVGPDIFVHLSACELPQGESPRIGDRCTYVVGADRRPGREPRVCARAVRFEDGA